MESLGVGMRLGRIDIVERMRCLQLPLLDSLKRSWRDTEKNRVITHQCCTMLVIEHRFTPATRSDT